MAEVLLDPITLRSNATVVSKASRIFFVKSNIEATGSLKGKIQLIKSAESSLVSEATVTGRFVKVVKSKSDLGAMAKMPPTRARVIKYVKASMPSKSTVVTKVHKFKTVRANLYGEATLESYVYDRDIRESMLGYLPPYYRDIKDIQSLIVSEANEFTMLYAKLDELFNQFFIDTATYSLDDWESATNVNRRKQKITERRKLVKQKLNGLGTITPDVLKGAVDEFFEVEVNELPEPSVIELIRVDRRGRYDNLDEVNETVNEIIPRHLQPKFTFQFMPWRELDMIRQEWQQVSEEITLGEASTIPWRDFEGTGATWSYVEEVTMKELEESYNVNIGGIKNE